MNDFPMWKPQFSTLKQMRCDNVKTRKRVIRNAASSFIKKPKVREALFSLKGDRCYICGAKATQIDHRISAYEFAENTNLDIRELNAFSNLYPICGKCNSSKSP